MTRGEKGKRTGCRMLLSLLLILSVLFPTGMPRAFAAQQGAQLIELRISDWSYEEYHQIRRYEYDGNGVLKRETSTSYSDERFREKRQESSTSYDYYDNGALRMSYGNGWEKHYDRFGTQIDGPVPAVPKVSTILSNTGIRPSSSTTISTNVMAMYIAYKIKAVFLAAGTSFSTLGPGLSARIKKILVPPDKGITAMTNTSTPIPPIQWVKLRQNKIQRGRLSTSERILAPVVEKPDAVSNNASI